jgi:hypothetical protein
MMRAEQIAAAAAEQHAQQVADQVVETVSDLVQEARWVVPSKRFRDDHITLAAELVALARLLEQVAPSLPSGPLAIPALPVSTEESAT